MVPRPGSESEVVTRLVLVLLIELPARFTSNSPALSLHRMTSGAIEGSFLMPVQRK